MPQGAITGYIDVAQLTLYAFWIFFAGLILYLRREDKREGYPLQAERFGDRVRVQGFPPIPSPKRFLLANGDTVAVPRASDPQPPLAAEPAGAFPGAPLEPTGDPMIDGVGPAAYALRHDVPDRSFDGADKIVPLRRDESFYVATEDTDPRGLTVYGADRAVAGTVVDCWVDRSETIIRYLEVAVAMEGEQRRVLLPMTLARITGGINPTVRAESLMARHFATAPLTASADCVTQREEDRICAYFASGQLYADPSRFGPLI